MTNVQLVQNLQKYIVMYGNLFDSESNKVIQWRVNTVLRKPMVVFHPMKMGLSGVSHRQRNALSGVSHRQRNALSGVSQTAKCPVRCFTQTAECLNYNRNLRTFDVPRQSFLSGMPLTGVRPDNTSDPYKYISKNLACCRHIITMYCLLH